MIYQATRKISEAFTEQNIKHKIDETASLSYVQAGFSGDNVNNMIVRFISSDDDNDVAVRVIGYVKAPLSKKDAVLECINKVHTEYRYARFSFDDDGDVNIAMDIPLRVGDVGVVAAEFFRRIINIADEVYPEFMKAIWA